MDDAIIIGGSFAGLAAALQFGRTLRKATVLDTGSPRNRFASHSHGLFGHDNRTPREILELARQQLATYPHVSLVDARAVHASGTLDDFTVVLGNGESLQARRLLLSYGRTDHLPDLPGFAECWGKTVVPCPYCHGYEIAGQHWGLLYHSPMSLHMPPLYKHWTDRITLFTDGHDLPAEERQALAERGVQIVDGKVSAIRHNGGALSAVELADGRAVEIHTLFAHPPSTPSSDLHQRLGLATSASPIGEIVTVDETQQTSVPGVYAAGDLANPMSSLTVATHAGAMAAIQTQRSLIV
ncbi:NAD(P)/FAD-dependent oxidoreductase [Devosia submarina]|uniref:NAD(P)/FAD-dependent oxidoreductase n=1 Tax=Devosia submarina TaxID=1173082 RepID=UPI000D3ABFFF|nr:NAD(P)/FAD-dependent oxidoreductase [Devosia submarina]